MPDHKYQTTIKAGTAYDAPWITISGDSDADLAFNLKAFTGTQTADTAELAVEAAVKLQNLWAVHDQLGGTPFPTSGQQAPPAFVPQQTQPAAFTPQTQAAVQQYQQSAAAPQAAPAAATPPAPVCQHGQMVYRESKPGTAKAWKAWFCSSPKGTPNQCDPQWIK